MNKIEKIEKMYGVDLKSSDNKTIADYLTSIGMINMAKAMRLIEEVNNKKNV